jgi:hypothetical protein
LFHAADQTTGATGLPGDAAPLRVLPTLWFRNTWSSPGNGPKPILKRVEFARHAVVHARCSAPPQASPADHFLYCDADVPLLFTEKETNNARLLSHACWPRPARTR